MRLWCIAAMIVAAVLSAAMASAQFGIEEDPNQAIEQLLLLRLVQQAKLDSYAMADVFAGYRQYREAMDALEEEHGALKAEIEQAVAGGQAGYDLTGKLNALMEVDRRILTAKQDAIREAGSVLSASEQAQLYLVVTDFDAVASRVRDALAPKSEPKVDAEAAPAAVEAAEAVSDEATIRKGIEGFSAQLIAKDIEGAMTAVADGFNHYEYGDKQGLKQFLIMAADMGYLDGMEVTAQDAVVSFEDDGSKATVKPIDAEGTFGKATLTLYLGRLAGEWKLVGLDIFGI
ncbi:MAG TPA: hypothetical protein PLO37_11910 [Candidatus Hydrogenedentes bacterium]|nr:hypothetical protein [Candidatus Hydrogenedentota bacterium]HPG67547.1 hypothetical protein [Candidatus Hydrogenedentota bacterium]